MKSLLLLLSILFTLVSCDYYTPAEYAKQYPIDGLQFPTCPSIAFCSQKEKECLSDVETQINKKLPGNEKKGVFKKIYDYSPAHDYCKIGYFGVANEDKCVEAMKLVCKKIHTKCIDILKTCK